MTTALTAPPDLALTLQLARHDLDPDLHTVSQEVKSAEETTTTIAHPSMILEPSL